jgi:hypothetical protein
MKRARLVFVVLLATLAGASVVGCERRVVGETYAGQLAGGRSLEVTADSPPRGATIAGAPATQPPSTRGATVRETDPSTRALLAASGARIPLRDVPRAHLDAPAPAPEPPPTPVAPEAAPAPAAQP